MYTRETMEWETHQVCEFASLHAVCDQLMTIAMH